MKKLILTATIFMSSLGLFAQKGYFGLGASYSNQPGLLYNVEAGCQTSKTWYSVTGEFANGNKGTYTVQNKSITVPKMMLGIRTQREIRSFSERSNLYGFISVKGGRYVSSVDSITKVETRDNFFQVEPGLSIVHKVNSHLSLQTSLSTFFNNEFNITGNWPGKLGISMIYTK